MPRSPQNNRPMRACRSGGFTLVELAIVVAIISILMTLGISAFSIQMDSAAASATVKRQEQIRDALVAYLRNNGRLPCPEVTAFQVSPPIGVESRQNQPNGVPDPTSSCQSYWGTVPYVTLGLSRDVALDGYDNFFTYFVSSAASTSEPDWTLTACPSSVSGCPGYPSIGSGTVGFKAGNPGRFAITDNGSPTTLSANLATVVLISHGKNGLGAFTIKGTRNSMPASGTYEAANAPTLPTLPNMPPAWLAPSVVAMLNPPPVITTLIINSPVDNSSGFGGAFDDIVMAVHPSDLLMPLMKDGSLKSAQAQVQDSLNQALYLVSSQLKSLNCIPPSHVNQVDSRGVSISVPSVSATNLAGWPNDPWGTPIQYRLINSVQLSYGCANGSATCFGPSNAPNSTAFILWSLGPNQVLDSDISQVASGFNALPPNGIGTADDVALAGLGWNITYQTLLNQATTSCQ
jgi:prepilin-type N-terminal cleavage/methylation domain-containing protein